MEQLESLEKAQKAAAEAAKSQDTFERELAAMQVQEFAFPADADANVEMEGAMIPASLVKAGAGSSLKSVVERLQEQLTVEMKAKELLDIEAEEITLKLEEVREMTQLSAKDETWTEEVQVEWHKEALWSYYKSHRAEMVQLQRRRAVLERANAQQNAQPKNTESHEDVASLKRATEQLSVQNDHLTSTLAAKNKFLEEQRYLQKTGLEMLETQRELELCLSEEINALQEREDQLESLARELCQIRQRQKQQRQLQSAEVARLQSRLHVLRSSGVGQVDPMATEQMELETLEVSVDCREAACDSEMWMSCLPSQVREDAGLGQSFDSICGLYRCYHKARILSHSIHQHCVARAALVQDLSLMRYLCSAMLVAAQLAYAVVGVLSCLQSTEVSKYTELSQLPSFTTAAHVGEIGLDALLRSFLQICRGRDESSSAQREALLAAVRAQGAQLMSLQKALFKDEQHYEVSKLRGACALEAFRAACAGALYGSTMAGGNYRATWQELYEMSDRLLGNAEVESHMELFSIVRPKQATSDEEEEEDMDDLKKSEASHALLAGCIDALMRHAVSLGAGATSEKESQQVRTFSLAEKELQTLSEMWAEAAEGSESKDAAGAEAQLPWEKLREKVRQDLQVAEQAAQPAYEQASKGLEKVELSMSTTQERLARAKDEMHEVEKNFGKTRLEAERLQLLLSSVKQRRKQAQKGGDACDALEKEVKHQSEQCEEMTANYQESSQHCEELRHRLNELERRIMRRYRDVAPEEVLALRRSVARQLEDIQRCKAKAQRNGHSAGIFQELWLVPDIRRRTDSESSETGGAVELWTELQKIREDLMNVMMTPLRLDEPEPEPSTRLQSLAKRVKSLRERVTECAKEEVSRCTSAAAGAPRGTRGQFDSVALTRFLKATNDAVRHGPMGKVKLPIMARKPRAVTLPLQMDEQDLWALHEILLPI